MWKALRSGATGRPCGCVSPSAARWICYISGHRSANIGALAMADPVILKYAAQNTPRYTSYPTAPHFHDGIDPGAYARWLGGIGPDLTGSIYIHIPYCREMCWYCGCSTRATRRDAPVDAYVDTLLKEIHHVAALTTGRPRIAHVHFGGGTPTLARPEKLGDIMEELRAKFTIAPDAEIAIEVDPRHCSAALANHLFDLGFNRASLGVQTFDAHVQGKINRIQSFETVAACATNLRAAGIEALSLDLLYGLPGQTEETCRQTVQAALRLRPDRLSVFGYAHVPHMRPHQKMIQQAELPGPLARTAQAMAIADALAVAEFEAIGIDHYARKDDAMAQQMQGGQLRRNFQGYTTDQADYLIGFGASAIGKFPQGFVQNAASTPVWARAIDAGHLATARGIALSPEDRLRADIIEKLMCDLRVDRAAIAHLHKGQFPRADLADLVADEVVREDQNVIRIPERYRLLARIVAARFDAHLENGTPAVHSKSV